MRIGFTGAPSSSEPLALPYLHLFGRSVAWHMAAGGMLQRGSSGEYAVGGVCCSGGHSLRHESR
eukprot:6057933-Pyramimonas_sp.AAC.2